MNFNNLAEVQKLCLKYYTSDGYLHALRVAHYAADNPAFESEDSKETAYLVGLCHDLIEDTNCTYPEIALAMGSAQSFVDNVIGLLTRRNEETYSDYISRLRSSNNKLAYIVKLCDIKDHLVNSDTLTDSLRDRYYKELPNLL